MNIFRSILNGKNALQQAQLNDLIKEIDDERLLQLQSILLDMYRDILSVCEEAGFTPFLVGGSALGAVRHQGFIPWDDDLDIGMLRSEYDSFLDLFEKKFSDKYIVNAPGKQEKTRARFTKIIKRNTVFADFFPLPEKELNGVFIDIFPIEKVPDNRLRRTMKGIMCDIVAYISSQVFNRENRTPLSITALKRTCSVNYHIRMLVGFLFGYHNASWWFKRFDRISQWNGQSNSYTIASGRKHYFGELLRQEIVWPPRYIQFMGISAPVFHDVDSYLKQLYGDYMIIPPPEKRERHFVTEIKF